MSWFSAVFPPAPFLVSFILHSHQHPREDVLLWQHPSPHHTWKLSARARMEREMDGRMLRFLYKVGTFLLQVPQKWYIPKAILEYHFKMHQVVNVVDDHLQFAQHTNNAVLGTPSPLTGCTNHHVSTVHSSEVSVWSNKFLSQSSKLYLSPWQSSWMFLLIH